MSWFRVDDKFHGHPKVKARSYGSRLVERNLWVEVDSGWRFHDWHEYQPTVEATDERRAALSATRSSAGRLGAAKRWQSPSDSNGKQIASAIVPCGKTVAGDGPVPIPSRPDPRDPPVVPVEAAVPTEPSTEAKRLPDPMGDRTIGEAWVEGIRLGAEVVIPVPYGGELIKLIALEGTLERLTGLVARCSRMQILGKEFGASERGKSLNVWRFSDWMSRRVPTSPTLTITEESDDYEDPNEMQPERLAERNRLAAELEAAIGAVH